MSATPKRKPAPGGWQPDGGAGFRFDREDGITLHVIPQGERQWHVSVFKRYSHAIATMVLFCEPEGARAVAERLLALYEESRR